MKAIVNTPVCSMYSEAARESTVVDEVLYGMVVELLEEVTPGWYRIRTHYRYEGIVPAEDLVLDADKTANWEALPKKVVLNKNTCDVLSVPKVQGWHMTYLPRGGLLSPVGEPQEDGWQRVMLADGRTGYVPAAILGQWHPVPASENEEELRKALVDTAMLYDGTQYRWGGKSPLGIDCSGFCSMAYMLCGILIYRDAKMVEGFPIHEIPVESVKPGDLLFFTGHVAMYIGDGLFCHVTGRLGIHGFTINSLDPNHPEYNAELQSRFIGAGSYF